MKEKKSPTTASTFAEELRQTYGFSTAHAKEITQTFLSTIEASLKDGRDVMFNRIGSIRVQEQEERVSVIPRTAKKILLSERRNIKFDASPVILKEINEGSGIPRTYTELTEEEAQEYIEQHKKRDQHK